MSLGNRITHLSYSTNGGAGLVAAQLVEAQRELGQNCRLLTVSSRPISGEPLRDPIQSLAALLDQVVLAKKSAELFSVFRAKLSRLSSEISEIGEVIHLHWLPGAISSTVLAELSKQSVRTVWTLHDYRPLTGACHYPQGCNGFEVGCKACPQARPFARAVVANSFDESLTTIGNLEIDFVAPSSGLFEAARHSQIGAMNRVHMIPNPVSSSSPSLVGGFTNTEGNRFLFAAANVEEARKGLRQALDWWSANRRDGERFVLVGKGSEKYSSATQGIVGLGVLSKSRLGAEYQRSSALIFSSSEDNAPGVLAEAAQFGLPVICLNPKMAKWLQADGLPLSELEQVRSTKESDPQILPTDYSLFLARRQPSVVARQYLDLYFRP